MKRLCLVLAIFFLLGFAITTFANNNEEGTALGATYDFNYPTFFFRFQTHPIAFELHFSWLTAIQSYENVRWSTSEFTVSPYFLFYFSKEFPRPFIGVGYESLQYLDRIIYPGYTDSFEVSRTTTLLFAGVEIGYKLYISPRLFLKFNEYRSLNLPDWNMQTVELSPQIAIYYCF